MTAARSGRGRGYDRGPLRPRHGLGGVARVGLAAVGVLGVAGCVAILDLDGYEDAVDRLCRCDDQLSFLSSRCREVLSTRLGNASAATRSAWLDYFAGHCAAGCQNAYECFSHRPTCADRDMSCGQTEECCTSGEGGGALQCLQQGAQTVCQ